MGSFTDKAIKCVDCGTEFQFTAGEQERFQQLGFTNEPKRCSPCRITKKAQSGGGGPRASVARDRGGPREMHSVTCSECGKPAQVPFKPRGDRPVYCSDCYSAKK